jgi:hypothetical protein
MLLHPVQVSELYPIGSVIEANGPPNENWLLCDGQLLAQADYSDLFNMMDRPHPIFNQWKSIYSGVDEEIYDVAYDGTYYVGSCYGSRMVYSSNGESWTSVALTTASRHYESIVYNATIGLFISVPYSNTSYTLYVTSPDGVNWTERALPATIRGREVASDGTYFYINNYYSTTFYRSSNGIDWTTLTVPFSSTQAMDANSSRIILSDPYGKYCISTDYGANWKTYDVGVSPFIGSCIYDSTDDVFVMCSGSTNYDDYVAISPGDDGINWEIQHLYYGYREYSAYSTKVVKAGSYYFLVREIGAETFYSSDLKTWNRINIPNGNWHTILYNSSTGYYYLLGESPFVFRWNAVDYDTNTYFRLPYANYDQKENHYLKLRNYIRVK